MLPVHLRDGQSIYFREDQTESALRRNSVRQTTLTAYFELNKSDINAHNYLYIMIFRSFTHLIPKQNDGQSDQKILLMIERQ